MTQITANMHFWAGKCTHPTRRFAPCSIHDPQYSGQIAASGG